MPANRIGAGQIEIWVIQQMNACARIPTRRFSLCEPGPMSAFRPSLPNAIAAGGAKAQALNRFPGVFTVRHLAALRYGFRARWTRIRALAPPGRDRRLHLGGRSSLMRSRCASDPRRDRQ
jgi:hypothetical protein